ncbi:MAG: prolipoprotein diacylglyceryl transferase [Cyclobacteriaceae bacterium]|nr:prolipoprotein diacylglyceryl transferase [Cyclobacteriaceae bacterium]
MQLGFIYWDINPEIINIMGFSLRYYGILFAGGIMLCIFILKWIFKNENIPVENLDTLTIYGVIGIIIGARLGHCLFYEPSYYLSNPLEIILPFIILPEGGVEFIGYQGLASHGGALGLIIALFFYSRKTKHPMIDTIDLIAVVAALSGGFIRLANLMNSEILGTPTTRPWGFIFERVDNVPRHPAQLYEAISYFLIFIIMISLYKTKQAKLKNGFFFGFVLVLIFVARFFVEFFKENQVGFEDGLILNMGQLLSLPYIFIGLAFMIYGLVKTNHTRVVNY